MRVRIHKGKCRRTAAFLLCAVMALLLAGCGSDEPVPVALKDGEQFSLAVSEQPDSLNPFFAESKLSEEFFLLTYDPLWRIDTSGEPVNCLVEDWSLSSDQLTWTIRLRDDVKFSDGFPLTAEDVRYTYEQMARSATAFDACFDGISSITCPDTYTVIISTEYVKGDMQYNQIPILPKHIWQELESIRGFENEEMIGSGPFARAIVETAPQEISWTFRAKEEYFGGAAKLGSVRYVYFTTETGAARALSAGEVDGAMGLTDVQLTTLESVPGVQLIQAFLPNTDVWALAFNTRSEIFQDGNLRQMIEYSLDRAWLLSMAAGEAGQTGSVWASPGVDYFFQLGNLRGTNIDTARSIVYASGYSDIDADGKMEYISTKTDFVLSLYSSADDDWSATAGTILGENLSRMGIQLDWETVDGDVTAVCTPKADWDMCLVSWRGTRNAVLGARIFSSEAETLTGWRNESYDQIYTQLKSAMDRPTVINLAGQLQQTLYNDCPYIVLAYPSAVQAIRSDRWTGYEQILEQAGAPFGTGCVDAYLSLEPAQSVG